MLIAFKVFQSECQAPVPTSHKISRVSLGIGHGNQRAPGQHIHVGWALRGSVTSLVPGCMPGPVVRQTFVGHPALSGASASYQ